MKDIGKPKKIENNITPIKIKEEITLLNLIKKTKVPLNKVAIELNQEIVNKKIISKIKLKNNDKIEVVHFIGGG